VSNYCIFRLRKRSLREARAMADHALRERATPNADPDRLAANTIIGAKTTSAVMSMLRARTDPLAKRKDAVRVIEFFIGASPEIMQKLSRSQQDQYFASALNWLYKNFGGDENNIVLAAIHRDETTPHLQVLLTPISDGKLAAKKLIGGPPGLRKLQDDFAETVGKRFGMRRGERGSKARHTSISQFYAAIQEAGKADALPPRVPIPPVPTPPGLLASVMAREAHSKALEARKQAIEANRSRQRAIETLAALGLEHHGRTRRRLPGRLGQVEALEASTAGAEAVIAAANELLRTMSGRHREEVLSQASELLAAQKPAAARPSPISNQTRSHETKISKPMRNFRKPKF